MYLLICFLLPSFISLQLERKMLSENDKNMNMILNYGIYVLLNNTITMIVLDLFCSEVAYNYQENINLYAGTAAKYAIISIVVAIILSIIKIIISKNLEVKIEVKNK